MATTSGFGSPATYTYENGIKVPTFGSAWDRRQAELATLDKNGNPPPPTPSGLDYYLKLLAGANPLTAAPAAPAPRAVGGAAPPGFASPVVPGITTPTGNQPYAPGSLSNNSNVTQPAGTAPLSPSNDVTAQALRDIQGFLSGNPDTSEWDTTSAERAAALGIAGSGTAAAEASRLRQSEIDKRQKMGIELLDPYLNRQKDIWTTVEQGKQAMDRLRLQEEGQNKRLSESERARLIEIAQQGAQALQIAQLNNATSLANNRTNANASLSNAGTAANTSRYNTDVNANTQLQLGNQRNSFSPQGQSLIDQILHGRGGGSSSGSSYYLPPDQSPAGQSATAREDAVKAAERKRQQDVWDNFNYDPLNPEGYDWENAYA